MIHKWQCINASHIKSLLKSMGIYKSLCVALTSYTVFENKGRCWNLCLRFLVQKLGTCSNEYTLIKGYCCKISSLDLTILLMSFYTTNFLTWFSHKVGAIMMTSSNGNISALLALCAGNSPHSDAELWLFFDLRLNIRLSKQSWGWWCETPPCSLWRHCNGCGNQLV